MPVIEIIKQDVLLAKKYFDDDKFALVNVIGNRVMSNFMVAKEADLMIIGWLLKELGVAMITINSYKDEGKKDEAKKIGKQFIADILEIISEKSIKIEKFYDYYFKYEEQLRKYAMNKPEDECYKEDLEFTRKNTTFYLEYLVKNKNILLDPRVQLIQACTNDLARVLNEHGGKKVDYVTYLLFRGFDRYFVYLLFQHNVEGVIEDKENFAKTIDGHLKNIESLIKHLDNESEFIKIADGLLNEFGRKHREFFIKFGDIYREITAVSREKKIEIPLDAREKIIDIVSKSFQEEIK